LSVKNKELAAIIKETEKEEKALLKKSEKAQEVIEERILKAYTRIRSKVVNGLAVVSVDRNACGGCFNQIPPQRQLDIQMHKKVIVCEHCGRILVDSNILES
jgi:predicted  nucleic acid-binding Zn-ribbon protein